MTVCQSILGYLILIGLLTTASLAILSGYYLVTSPHVTTNDQFIPSGPSINIEGVPSSLEYKEGVLLRDEFHTASNLMWVCALLTGSAICLQLHLHVQVKVISGAQK